MTGWCRGYSHQQKIDVTEQSTYHVYSDISPLVLFPDKYAWDTAYSIRKGVFKWNFSHHNQIWIDNTQYCAIHWAESGQGVYSAPKRED